MYLEVSGIRLRTSSLQRVRRCYSWTEKWLKRNWTYWRGHSGASAFPRRDVIIIILLFLKMALAPAEKTEQVICRVILEATTRGESLENSRGSLHLLWSWVCPHPCAFRQNSRCRPTGSQQVLLVIWINLFNWCSHKAYVICKQLEEILSNAQTRRPA